MKTKYGFPIKKTYTVKEISTNLMVSQNVLQNYLYKKNLVAKLNTEYCGDELLMILEAYSKEAHLRKEETIERAKYLANKLTSKEVKEENIKEEVESIVEEVVMEEVVVEVKEEEGRKEAKESLLGFDFNVNGESLLKIINWVSMVSALIGIYKELKWLGVVSLGFITCLFLIYSLIVMSNEESGGLKKFVACVAMAGVEWFWAVFHIKTFSSFDNVNAIFGMNTSFITACVIGGLSFVCLLIQAFKNSEL